MASKTEPEAVKAAVLCIGPTRLRAPTDNPWLLALSKHAGCALLRVPNRQHLFIGIDDKHRQQPRRLRIAGIGADAVGKRAGGS